MKGGSNNTDVIVTENSLSALAIRESIIGYKWNGNNVSLNSRNIQHGRNE